MIETQIFIFEVNFQRYAELKNQNMSALCKLGYYVSFKHFAFCSGFKFRWVHLNWISGQSLTTRWLVIFRTIDLFHEASRVYCCCTCNPSLENSHLIIHEMRDIINADFKHLRSEFSSFCVVVEIFLVRNDV